MIDDQIRDQFAITRVIHQVARALDRRDKPLLQACFWPDATDDHGVFSGNALDFVDWVMGRDPEPYVRTQHNITNLLVDLTGDRAAGEAYFIAYHRMAAEATDVIVAGRYLDRFERRAGEWRIVHRHAVYEWTTHAPASDPLWSAPPLVNVLTRGRRNTGDPSYANLAWLGGSV